MEDEASLEVRMFAREPRKRLPTLPHVTADQVEDKGVVSDSGRYSMS